MQGGSTGALQEFKSRRRGSRQPAKCQMACVIRHNLAEPETKYTSQRSEGDDIGRAMAYLIAEVCAVDSNAQPA
eukprot:scaffold649078_cov46-Prasinocladus_malaysianus.AAC.1